MSHSPEPPPDERPVVEVPRIPEHSRLYRFLQHPFLYVLLFALWFACEQGEWLPRHRPPPTPARGAEAREGPGPRRPFTLSDLLRGLLPEGEASTRRSKGAAWVATVPLALGAALLLAFLALRAAHVRLLPEGEAPVASWDTWHLARCAIAFLVIYRLTSAGMAEVQRLGAAVSDAVLVVLATNAMFLATCGFVFLLLAVGGQPPLRALGLWDRRVLSRAASGVLAFLACLPVIAMAGAIMYVLWRLLGRTPRPQAVLEAARGLSGGEFVAVVVAGAVIAPLTEEILFRGFVYSTLRRYAGPAGSIVVSALAFALLHEAQAFLPIFVIGCLLAWLFERTGSLAAPIAAHAANNLYTFLIVTAHFR